MKILSIDNKDEAKIIIKLCNSKDKKIKWVETTEKSGKLEFLESHYINNDDFSVELFFNSEFITLEFVKYGYIYEGCDNISFREFLKYIK